MHPTALEAKVRELIDRVIHRQPVEASHVEIKREWPDANKAARHIAGLCNAARGAPVIWIVGLDEKTGAVTTPSAEFANMWSAIRGEFDGEAPSVIHNLPIRLDCHTVVALLFDASRAPFVVRNVAHNAPGGGPVTHEVPWREGNAIRTARRHELIRMLAQAVHVPSIEVLNATASYYPGRDHECLDGVIGIEVYVETENTAVIVPHRSSIAVTPSHMTPAGAGYLPDESVAGMPKVRRSVAVRQSESFELEFSGPTAAVGGILPQTLECVVRLSITGLGAVPEVAFTLLQDPQLSETRSVHYSLRRAVGYPWV